MVAVEFAQASGSPHDPNLRPEAPKNLASRVAKRCIEKGMYILTTSVYEVIRFIPPLNISKVCSAFIISKITTLKHRSAGGHGKGVCYLY